MTNRPEEMLKHLIDEYRGTSNATADYLPGLAAFGLGIVVGAGVALLFAPSTGEALREEIVERVDDLKHRVIGDQESEKGVSNAGPVAEHA